MTLIPIVLVAILSFLSGTKFATRPFPLTIKTWLTWELLVPEDTSLTHRLLRVQVDNLKDWIPTLDRSK